MLFIALVGVEKKAKNHVNMKNDNLLNVKHLRLLLWLVEGGKFCIDVAERMKAADEKFSPYKNDFTIIFSPRKKTRNLISLKLRLEGERERGSA
jgi:hypothetical protein